MQKLSTPDESKSAFVLLKLWFEYIPLGIGSMAQRGVSNISLPILIQEQCCGFGSGIRNPIIVQDWIYIPAIAKVNSDSD